MNQYTFEENTCNRLQVLKNRCEKDTIGFSFVSLWLKKWRKFENKSQILAMENHTKREITFPTLN